jgi:rfaE bifunctional protein nucleotidyltransferase chain/domain
MNANAPGPVPGPSPCAWKLCSARVAAAAIAKFDEPVVFTNGVFDLLHRGHVNYLAAARALGGMLVVGLNSDASVRRLGKGAGRPINAEFDRACVLCALESVSMVVLFEEDTPLALLEQLRPDLYVKGGDYDVGELAESRLVARWGGRALALPLTPEVSTTRIVRRIVETQTRMAPRLVASGAHP